MPSEPTHTAPSPILARAAHPSSANDQRSIESCDLDQAIVDVLATRHPRVLERIAHAPRGARLAPLEGARAIDAVASINIPRHDPRMGPPVVVLGPGRGERLRALLGRFGSEIHVPLLVIAPDAAALRATLAMDPWLDLLTDDRVRIACGPDVVAQARAAFNNDDAFSLGSSAGLAGDAIVEHAMRTEDAMWSGVRAAIAADVAAGFETLQQPIAAWRGEDRFGRAPDVDDDPAEVRVFARGDARTTALQFLVRDLADAAARRGHAASALVLRPEADCFAPFRLAHEVARIRPHVVYSPLLANREHGAWLADVPTAVHFTSDPARWSVRAKPWSNADTVFIADPTWRDRFDGIDVPVHHLPLAARIPEDDDIDGMPAPACDVLIVGHLAGSRDVADHLDDAAHAQVAEIARAIASARTDEVDALVDRAWRADDEGAVVLRRAVLFEATAIRRVEAAKRLVEAGFDVRIHGDERWRDRLGDHPAVDRWFGPLQNRSAMPAAFSAATLSLNLVSLDARHALNMRAYDVPAAGGVLLCDDRPALHEAFAVGAEALAFSGLDTLADGVADALRDPDRLASIRAAGRERVRREHSWDARWIEILARIGRPA